MTKDNKSEKKTCSNKKGAMLAYGVIQLGSSIISALSLAAIALSFCAVKQESKFFNDCVKEMQAENSKSSAEAVRLCNGGN